MSQNATLFVGWQNQGSRRWYVVARLVRSIAADGKVEYAFEYVRGAEDAALCGFQPFVAFPNQQEVVRSRVLLPFFGNRVMPSNRPDYRTYLDQLGLETSAEELDILARSGGQRTSERSEVEVFAPPLLRKDGIYETHFFLRGLSHSPAREEDVASLRQHDVLPCMLDVHNPVNPAAVALRTDQQVMLGYVPDYLCRDVSCLLKEGHVVRASIARVNDASAPRPHRILCRMELEPPPEYRFLSGHEFEPLVRNLSRAA
jgi:hypothetical protein